MTNTTAVKNEMDFLINEDLRNKMLAKVEVLNKVKGLMLLPNTELMTTKMVAEYFEVDVETIKKSVTRNKEELQQSGLKLMSYKELAVNLNGDNMSLYKIPKRGATIFSKRAVLNLAMLLRDSSTAKEVRTALLDQQEVMTDEQKVKGIDNEEALLLNILRAKDKMNLAIAVNELINHNERHINQLNEQIEEKNEKIEVMKPKEAAYDSFIKAENAQSLSDVAKVLGIGRNGLIKALRDGGILMKTGTSNVPYQKYIKNGHFIVKESTSGAYNIATTYVTAKGVKTIDRVLAMLAARVDMAEKID